MVNNRNNSRLILFSAVFALAFAQGLAFAYDCIDSDGGNVPGTFGYVTVGPGTYYEDYCPNTNTLMEMLCVNNYDSRTQVSCSYGCSGGKCNSPPPLCTSMGQTNCWCTQYYNIICGSGTYCYTTGVACAPACPHGSAGYSCMCFPSGGGSAYMQWYGTCQ